MPEPDNPLIEIGVLVAGPMDAIDLESVEAAFADARGRLEGLFPAFTWRTTVLRRDEWDFGAPAEPSRLLQPGRDERDERRWDFAFVVTAADLASHYKPYCYAVLSTALDVAVVSTARIDPRSSDPTASDAMRRERLTQGVRRLAMHTLGHWLGLSHQDDPGNVMHAIDSLDGAGDALRLTETQQRVAHATLEEVADQRLEEDAGAARWWAPIFYTRAAWRNRRAILGATYRARPWEFPVRLARLSTAALSACLVLLMTAETWDMATRQPWSVVAGMLLLAVGATTAYVATQQQLLLRRNGRRISEQIVASNLTAVAIVACGMLVEYGVLFALTLLAGEVLFPPEVVDGWAASVEVPLSTPHYVLVAGTVSGLSLLIGALGASFEQQHYFRHVVYVDEEV